MNGSLVIFISSTQKTPDAEGTARVTCTQDMLCIMQIIKSLGLDVKKPIVLEMNNKGALDLQIAMILGMMRRAKSSPK